ncbi:MAG: V-type ATPase subunit [Thermoplasmatales archaeon]|nr:MAG: V-type ATPase subunit [Thermoplasmatales archaeon]
MLDLILDPYGYPFWILVFSIIIAVFGLVFRPFLTHIKFAYPNALFEAIGNPYVDEKEINRILDCKDLSGFVDSINTLKNYNITGDNSYEIQRSLDDHFVDTINMMKKDSPKDMSDFYNVYLEKLDLYQLKNLLKNKLEDIPVEDFSLDDVILETSKELMRKIKDFDKKEIPDILKNYGFEKEIIDVVSNEKTDFFSLDNEINKHLINKFRKVKVPNKCDQGKHLFINRMIDILNIKNILRAKQLGYDSDTTKKLFLGEGQEIAAWKFKEIAEVDQVSQVISSLEGTSYYNVLKDNIEEYNKEESVQVLENALDGLFLKLVKDISLQYFVSIGPSIRFLVSKEFEIQNLKVVTKGLGENLPPDIINKFMVMEAKA